MLSQRQFAELVNLMRTTQKEYFRTRAAAMLQQSKRYEKQVDTELELQIGQLHLFETEPTHGS